jgi:pyruvate/2-oxoglutarate/acetoin dehydrogenase E1 component
MSETIAAARKFTFAQGINMALHEAMAADPSVILLGEDVADEQTGGVFKVTKGLSATYGTNRVISTPIAEQGIMGAAVGAAIAGMRPVAEIMLMNFITVAMDQLVNHAAKLRFMSGGQTGVPLTVRTATGAGAGFGGQHSDMLEAWFAHCPGLKVVTAANPADAKGLLLAAIEDDDPVIFIENFPTYYQQGEAPPEGYRVPLGKAAVTWAGTDISIISYGRAIKDCLAAADLLAGEGISAEVIDLRTIAPFDRETILNCVAKTKRAVVVHEAVKPFGVGAEISSCIHENLFSDLHGPVTRIGSKWSPVPFASVLERAFLYNVDEIVTACRTACH